MGETFPSTSAKHRTESVALAISTSHESIRIESLVEGAFACSHIHHTRVERNDCRRGCVGGSHTLMDGLIGHRVSG